MTEALITSLREYIEDPTQPYVVSDTIIERWLNKSRQYVDSLQIYAEDYGYDNLSRVYLVGYKYLMNVTLKDGNGDAIDSDDYTVDAFNGIITFDSSPVTVPDAVYVTFTYHDFWDAVCNIWLYRASLATTMKKAQLGDEVIPEDKNSVEYCVAKYWTFRQSVSRQMEK